ncbi:MAG: hypothetical protein M3N09_03240 [Actinomycetota bacterium]|nr:hypothetical protein [Actinomycetota bacterium]
MAAHDIFWQLQAQVEEMESQTDEGHSVAIYVYTPSGEQLRVSNIDLLDAETLSLRGQGEQQSDQFRLVTHYSSAQFYLWVISEDEPSAIVFNNQAG